MGATARFGAIGVALGVAIGGSLAACGSSSDHSASADASSERGLSTEAASGCSPFGTPCGPGQTCCLSGLEGTCAQRTACASPLQFECSGPRGCEKGQVCCASVPLGLDASVLNNDAARPVLVGVTAGSVCATSCSSPSFTLCSSASDCPAGATCNALPEGDLVLVALGAETLTACSADAGVPSG